MSEKPSVIKDMPSPPSSGLTEILSLFQKIEDKYVSGNKPEDGTQETKEESLMTPKKDEAYFTQSTEAIYAMRMQQVLAKYSQGDKTKLTKSKSKASKTQASLGLFPQTDKLFSRHPSGVKLPYSKNKLDKHRQSQPSFLKEIEPEKQEFLDKIPKSPATNLKKSTSINPRTPFFSKKKSMPGVVVPSKQAKNSSIPKSFINSFKPAEIKVSKTRDNLVSMAKSPRDEKPNASFSSKHNYNKISCALGTTNKIDPSPRPQQKTGNLSALDRSFQYSLLHKPRDSREASKNSVKQRVKVYFKADTSKGNTDHVKKATSAPRRLREGEIFSAKSSLNNISNLQIINSNIYFPVVDAKSAETMNSYISLQKKDEGNDGPQNLEASSLSEVFKKTNKKRLENITRQSMDPSLEKLRFSKKTHDKPPSNKPSTGRSIERALNHSNPAHITEKKFNQKTELEGLSSHPSEKSATYHLYKPKSREGISSKYLNMDKNKLKKPNTSLQKDTKRISTYQTQPLKDHRRDYSEMNQYGSTTLLDNEDSLAEFTILEDIISKEEVDSNSKVLEEPIDCMGVLSPTMTSIKKLKYIKDDIENDKKKIEKNNPVFDNTQSSSKEESSQKKRISVKEKGQTRSDIKRKHASIDFGPILPSVGATAVPKYYMKALRIALLNEEDSNRQHFVDHLKHTVQSMSYILGVEAPHEDDILETSVYLPPLMKKGRINLKKARKP